jgi:hypothetical protein
MTSDTELFTGPDCQKLMSQEVELLHLCPAKPHSLHFGASPSKFGLPFDTEHFQKLSKTKKQ